MNEERLGPYTLKQRIGRGGMAEVLRATGPDGDDVVVKRMLPHLVEEPAYVKMFLREARIAAQLHHPNVVRLLDVDREGESLYLVFELVDGVTLYELARRAWQAEKPIPIELCARAVADAAIGLHHAHELRDENGALANLVHRDVSPDNLMIDKHGVTHVLDFGIARVDDTQLRVSKTGELRGKLAFMSPEQAQGLPLDRRSDLFSLGTTLFWLLTAQKPFAGRTDILTLRALLEQDAPVPSTVNPNIPHALDPIVMRLLKKDPAERYATGAQVHDAISFVLPKDDAKLRAIAGAFVAEISALGAESKEGTVVVEMPAPTVPSASVLVIDSEATKTERAPRPRTLPMFAIGAAAVLACAAIVAFVWASASTNVAPISDAHPPAPLLPEGGVPRTSDEPRAPEAAASPSEGGGQGGGRLEPAVDVDDVPLAGIDHVLRLKRVQLTAPAGVTWRARIKGDGADVKPNAKSIVAVDADGGVHEVPIVGNRADYNALAKGSLRVWLPPSGGEVFLGARSLGQAPIAPLTLVAGKYKMRARIAGSDKIEEQIVVVGAGSNVVRFK